MKVHLGLIQDCEDALISVSTKWSTPFTFSGLTSLETLTRSGLLKHAHVKRERSEI